MKRLIIPALMLVPSLAAAQSGDLFVFEITETGNPSNTLTVGGSVLPDLAQDLADTQGDFDSFSGVPFDAMIRYAGVDDAVAITYDPTGGSAGGELVTITSLAGYNGPPIVFDAADGDLGDQLQDFFLKNNPDTIKDFLSAVAALSPVAVTDGNPLASTARSAKYRFDRFGLFADLSPADPQLNRLFAPDTAADPDPLDQTEAPNAPTNTGGSATTEHGAFRSRIDFFAQAIETDDFSGSSFDLTLSNEIRFSDEIALVVGVPLSYHTIEDADVFNAGLHVDLPINLLLVDEQADSGLSWQVTPGGSIDGVGSYDFAAGGVLYTLGLTSSLRYDIGRLTLIAAQQYTYHKSINIDSGDYAFDPGVDQQILKLGGKLVWRFEGGAVIYGGATWTDFLEDSAIDDYTSPVAGIMWQPHSGFNILAGYEDDFGDGYTSHGGRLSIQFPF
ncbi:MAG TPA: hypothetical protein ENJ00_04090 [Phycisphaerales bacterium]|nr:hypothetical protein [Phycisphaerales bacterium]